MISPSQYEFAEAFFFVERTVDAVTVIHGEAVTVRIEVLFQHGSGYSTRSYIQKEIRLHPMGANTGWAPAESRAMVWVGFDLTGAVRDTADEALARALGRLRQISAACVHEKV